MKIKRAPEDGTRSNNSLPLPEPPPTSNASNRPDHPSKFDETLSVATLSRLINRLDALLMVLKTCEGRRCTHPWDALFPAGEAKNLAEAVHRKFDKFFETDMAKVRFDQCETGYIVESEGPMWTGVPVYGMTEEISF